MARLITIGGAPATGKSTLARFLEKETGIKRISMDDLKETFFDLGGCRDREWSKEIGALAWPTFQGLINMHVGRGDNVIAEATFLWPDDHLWIQELSDRNSADLIQFWMSANPMVARERFVHRANTERHPGHCDALEHVMEEFDERFFNKSFIPMPISGKTKIVDTTNFDDVDHDEILRFIS